MNLQRILKDSIVQLIDLWNTALSTDYLLHVEHTYYQEGRTDDLLVDHYLFGDIDWTLYDQARWHKQHTFHINAKLIDVKRFINEKFEGGRIDLVLLSNDLIYAFHFLTEDSPQITVDLSSAIFGKGTHHNYVVATRIDGNWLLSSPFDRGKKYEGFQGSLLQCAEQIFNGENEMDHPYQWMIDRHPNIYRDATKHKRRFI